MNPPEKRKREKGIPSFFTGLRQLGREVDHGVKDLQAKFEAPDAASDSHSAIKVLMNRKKYIQKLKSSARSSMKEMVKRGAKFEETVQTCSDVLEAKLSLLTHIHTHLIQYGYLPPTDCEEDDIKIEGKDESTACDVKEQSATPPPEKRGAKEELEDQCNLTPRLEDYGLSSFALNLQNQRAKPAEFKVPKVSAPESVRGPPRHDSVPSPFQNRGLTVTPSLFSSWAQFSTEGKAGSLFGKTPQDALSLACSPEVTTSGQRPEMEDQGPANPPHPPGNVAKTLDFSDSPVPPVLHTPGIKQIPRCRDAVFEQPESRFGKKSKAAKQLHLGGDCKACSSPIPPILMTPGIQQIKARSAAVSKEREDKGAPLDRGLDMPKSPELTYSLKELEAMTMSFRTTDLSATLNEKSTIEFDTLLDNLPEPAYRVTRAGQLPPMPPSPPVSVPQRPLSTDVSIAEPQLSAVTRDRFVSGLDDVPATPELTMNYSALAAHQLRASPPPPARTGGSCYSSLPSAGSGRTGIPVPQYGGREGGGQVGVGVYASKYGGRGDDREAGTARYTLQYRGRGGDGEAGGYSSQYRGRGGDREVGIEGYTSDYVRRDGDWETGTAGYTSQYRGRGGDREAPTGGYASKWGRKGGEAEVETGWCILKNVRREVVKGMEMKKSSVSGGSQGYPSNSNRMDVSGGSQGYPSHSNGMDVTLSPSYVRSHRSEREDPNGSLRYGWKAADGGLGMSKGGVDGRSASGKASAVETSQSRNPRSHRVDTDFSVSSSSSACSYPSQRPPYPPSLSQENVTPGMPDLPSSKLKQDPYCASLPPQPKLLRPLADSNLDPPRTPELTGTYHFMSSKK